MMMVHPQDLDASELHAYRATQAFLSGRLGEPATIDWALNLRQNQRPQLAAVRSMLRTRDLAGLAAIWKDAWRLIEESWSGTRGTEDEFSEYEIRERLAAGERSSNVIGAIVKRVEARVQVSPFSSLDYRYRDLPREPRRVTDLFNVSMTSGPLLDPDRLKLDEVNEANFLAELASALDLSLLSALAQGRRMGWNPETALWRFGSLNRVYFVPENERRAEEHEPDEFSHGIAPSVKLLLAVVTRIAAVEDNTARAFLDRWLRLNSSVYDRIWAALAVDLANVPEIYQFLSSRSQRRFWDTSGYPEIAELRARSFSRFSVRQQELLCRRIRRGPPLNLWRTVVENDVRRERQEYIALRELRRIEVANGKLPKSITDWYLAGLKRIPAAKEMARIDDGFPGLAKAHAVPPSPDHKFDLLTGLSRLRSLEKSLRSQRVSWTDDPAEGASDWIRSGQNVLKVLRDLESVEDTKLFSRVWERFGWTHGLPTAPEKRRSKKGEAGRVANLICELPEEAISEAIEGLTWWFSVWGKYLDRGKALATTWRKLWPTAVRTTNRTKVEQDVELTVETAEPVEPRDIDTLNNPVGRMVGVFLEACPNLRKAPKPFRARGTLTTIRNQIVAVEGRSRLIATHRLLEYLPYFLKADPAWTERNLLAPLRAGSEDALVLWHAIARRTHFQPVLQVLGNQMLQRATDVKLTRSTRQSLVFSLVVECLHSLREGRRSAVPYPEVQQVLRSVEDEVRAHAADVLQQFVREMSAQEAESKALLFDSAIAPFLASVWPHERSLATPGVARVLSDLPASVPERFTEAVEAIGRFLVPFDAWSSMEYGLYGTADDNPKLGIVDTEKKAAALLFLLDATIGTAEGSVIPHDLSDMLAHIRAKSARSSKSPAFRRLAAAARI